jgi:hypothetical protein
LVLAGSAEIAGPEYRGYEIAAGSNLEGFVKRQITAQGILLIWQWATYLLAILLAVSALVGSALNRAGRGIRGNAILAVSAGILSLSEVTQLAVTWQRNKVGGTLFTVWLILWAAPIVIWLVYQQNDAESGNRARAAIMVFYLPIFLVSLGFLPFVTYLSSRYAAFMAGILLLWWGFLQGGSERTKQASRHGCEPEE